MSDVKRIADSSRTRITPEECRERTHAPQQRSKQHVRSTMLRPRKSKLAEVRVGVRFGKVSRPDPKRERKSVKFWSRSKNRQLHLRYKIFASDRLPCRRNFKSSAALQQHYRRSRVHLSLQIDQEATEMEKCDEEIFVGYRWFSSIGHSRSRIGRGYCPGLQGAAAGDSCLRLEWLLPRPQRRWSLESQLLGCHELPCTCRFLP